MKSLLKVLAVAAGLSVSAPCVHAAVVTLDFDQLNGGTDGHHFEEIRDYYAGGFGSLGSGHGPNYGITFSATPGFEHLSSAAIAYCNTASCPGNSGVAGATSGPNSLLVFGNSNDLAGAILNVPGGFRGTVDFDAATTDGARFQLKTDPGNRSFMVNSIIDNFGVDASSCPPVQGVTCPFVHYSISFEGVAHTLIFNTSFRGPLGVDNLTFSDLTLPTTTTGGGGGASVPEPASWALMIAGFALTGAALRRRAGPGSQTFVVDFRG